MGFSVGVLIGIVVIAVLLILSALVSGSEVAFFALGPNEIETLKKKKGRIPKISQELLSQPENLLATILIGNNFINVGIVILSTWVTHALFDFSATPVLGFIIQIIAITFIILLFGEIIPKVYATRFSLRFVSLMAMPIYIMMIIFKPVAFILIGSTSRMKKRLKETKRNISMDELSQALELTGEQLDDDEKILKGIVKFGHTDVNEIMKSRVDVVAIELSTPFKDLIKTITDTGFSRIPVYREDFDHVSGVLYVKDLLPHLSQPDSFRWQSLVRPPYFVPENKKINDLLEEFQKNKIHLALVVDEYGGTAGLVTLEDILEEIVGEISDESDEEETLFKQLENNIYLFEAKVLLNDFYRILELDEDIFDSIKGEAETLAGLILELKGEIPDKGETFKYGGYIFTIDEVDERRISAIRVTIPK